MTPSITIKEMLQAAKRLQPHLPPTPLEAAPELGEAVYFKLENLNKTRSFKIRGALNALLALSEEERERGIVACSAGNHAQGIAYAAQLVGIQAKIVMPSNAPKRKVKGVRKYGADILLHGDTYDAAELQARKMEAQMGMTFLSPYNHPLVLAGQGTVALELFEALPEVGRIIVPTSGGGLLAGIAIVAKTINKHCQIIGAQSVATPAMHNFYYQTHLPQEATIADGLSGEIEGGSITLDLCKRYVDQIVLVYEDQIRDSIAWMLEQHNWIIEGAAAVGIAALRAGFIPTDDGIPTAILVTGANIDYDTLRGIIQ
jgi:threonine dehydratase